MYQFDARPTSQSTGLGTSPVGRWEVGATDRFIHLNEFGRFKLHWKITGLLAKFPELGANSLRERIFYAGSLRLMDRTPKLSAIALSLFLVACNPTQDGATGNSSHNYLKKDPLMAEIASIVGSEAKSCGRVSLGQDPTGAWHCAKVADSQGAPHWFAMQREGIDSEMWSASLLSPSGERFILIYDSNYMGGSGLLPSFTRMTCDGNVTLAPSSPDGSGLTCERKRRDQ